jgi:glycosyltransferase involved in cell wall biosynthesis
MGRNEEFMGRTIDDVLSNSRGDTRVICVLDGYWPDPPLPDNPRVTVIHHTEPVGQRAAFNEGARLSQAKYIMKLDAHCSVGEGFDIQLMKDCKRRNWTLVPAMWNLHAFDWVCNKCGKRYYQADLPEACCDVNEFKREMVWKPRHRRITTSWRFDKDMRFQYWRGRNTKGKIFETMSCIGACWFIHRERHDKTEGLDEGHGSWGQVGTEIACKSWLSGGKLLTDTNTWFAHMFRTNNKKFGFPYDISGNAQQRAREYSQDLWLNNKWPQQKHNLEWLVERFKPVPGWHD